MKTLTEFPSQTLKNAAKTHQELTAAGKTPEELPAALGEALKVEGDKLTRLIAAIEVVGTRFDDLKRVVVLQTTAEGEKAPSGAQQKGELYYVTEYYASLQPQKPAGRGDRDDRGGKKGRGGKGRRDGKGGRGGERGERGEKRAGGGAGSEGGERGDRRPPREPRAPRPAPARPAGGFKVIPKGQTAAAAQAPTPAANEGAPAAPATEAPKSE